MIDFDYGKLIVQAEFNDKLEAIKSNKIHIPNVSSTIENDFQSFEFPAGGDTLKVLDGEICTINLNAQNGRDYIFKGRQIEAYDESIDKYQCIEGDIYITAHSLIKIIDEGYCPIGYVAVEFYTRSKSISDSSNLLRYSESVEMQAKIDCVKDKLRLLAEETDNNSLLLVDGPLIGGDVYTYVMNALHKFVDKNIIPVFFVKNTNSNLVTDNIKNLIGKFNSDLHWAYTFLERGQRTNYFHYADKINPKNAKIFCYIKLFDGSPQRIEFYSESFYKNRLEMDRIVDCIYYLAILQGQQKNPQIRPIAIAEKYAREYIRLCDIKNTIKRLGLTPTINEERFGR